MILTIAQFFIYLAVAAPILVNRSLFFPFITGKQIFFRFSVEAALACFLIYLIVIFFNYKSTNYKEAWSAIKKHLRHPVIICLSIFALAMVVASITSPSPVAAFWSNYERGDGAFQILHYVLFAILIKLLFTNEKKLERLLWSHIFTSIIVCAYAFGQMLVPENSPSFFIAAADRVSGTLGNPSYLAAYLIFTLAIIAYLLLKTKDPLVKSTLGTLGVIQIFLMVKAQTLGVGVGVFVGLLVFAVHLYLTTEHKKLKTAGAIVAGTLVGLTILFLSTKSLDVWQKIPLFKRITDFNKSVEAVRPRLWAWQSAVEGSADRPITGWGLENFAIPFDRHYNPYHFGRESFFDRTHNLFLEYMIGGGALALVPWLLIFFFYYRDLRKRPNSVWKSVAIAVPIMYLVQGVFLFDVLPIYLAFLVFLIFIVNTNPQPEHRPNLPEPNGLMTPVSYTGIGLTIIAVGILMFATAYRPIKRNKLLIVALNQGAILTQQLGKVAPDKLKVTPEQALANFKTAIDYPSPVGKGESIEMYHKFVTELLSVVAQIPEVKKNNAARSDVTMIMNGLNALYDESAGIVPGVKDVFTNASLNIQAGIIFNLPELATRGRKSLETALVTAPRRIELIRGLLELAQATGDEKLFNQWLPPAIKLRPDLFEALTSTPAK